MDIVTFLVPFVLYVRVTLEASCFADLLNKQQKTQKPKM